MTSSAETHDLASMHVPGMGGCPRIQGSKMVRGLARRQDVHSSARSARTTLTEDAWASKAFLLMQRYRNLHPPAAKVRYTSSQIVADQPVDYLSIWRVALANGGFEDVAASDGTVLAVDLDGTLLKTDTLLEGLLVLLRERPFDLFPAALSLPRGRAALKSFVTDNTSLDIASLPLNIPLIEWLEAERATGRYLVLVTAADHRIADAVAARIGLFDEVLASDGRRNLKGENKAAALIARFGQGGFDYVGDARADRSVWRAARNAIVVGGPKILETARQVAEVERVFQPDSGLLPAALRALGLDHRLVHRR